MMDKSIDNAFQYGYTQALADIKEKVMKAIPVDRFGSFNECKDIILSNLEAIFKQK